MASAPKFPIIKRAGSVIVKIYRVTRTNGQEIFTVAWVGPHGRETAQYGRLDRAQDEAQLKADQMAAGLAEMASRGDLLELSEARRIAGSVPVLTALAEWAKARELVGDDLLPACRQFKDAKTKPAAKRIQLGAAIDEFIAAKEAAGKKGRTYRAKLKAMLLGVGDLYLDTITAAVLTKWLNGVDDAVTRNDLRKRAFSMFLWARRVGYLPRGEELEIAHTERAKEAATEIGILMPAVWRDVLKFFHDKHPQHLAAVVVAGFCGLRSDEIHGKRDDREIRQVWEDLLVDERAYLRVTNAKTNTPQWRHVPLCPAALEWLKLCPGEHKGPVCEPAAMEKVRALAIEAGHKLPENCFRHSYITMDIAVHENKAATANRAGNSEAEINRRYRVPMAKAEGLAWFGSTPRVVLGKKPARR